MVPEIRYIRSADGTRIATASVGSGPPLLMMIPTGTGSIEMTFGASTGRATSRHSRGASVS